MRKSLLILTPLCLAALLSGCTQGSSGQPAPPPTKHASAAPTPSAPPTTSGPSSASTPAPSATGSVPGSEYGDRPGTYTFSSSEGPLLAVLNYKSPGYTPEAYFPVTSSGYRVTYSCVKAPESSVLDAYYDISGKDVSAAHVKMTCDSKQHSREFHPHVTSYTGPRTVSLPGDKQGLEAAHLEVEVIGADAD